MKNLLIKYSILASLTFFIKCSISANVLEPEECILETIKTQKSEYRGYIEKQCVKQFVIQKQKIAKNINPNLVSDAKLSYGWILFDGNGFIVHLKNNSDKRLISIFISLTKKDGSENRVYKLFADAIVEPYSFGKFSQANLLEVNQQYFDDRNFQIIKIYAIDD